jgi:hypothetical protein
MRTRLYKKGSSGVTACTVSPSVILVTVVVTVRMGAA